MTLKKKTVKRDKSNDKRNKRIREKVLSSESEIEYTSNLNLREKATGGSVWTEEMGEHIVNLVADGKTYRQISEIIGVSDRIIGYWIDPKSNQYKREFAEEVAVAFKSSADVFEHRSLMIAQDISNDMYADETKFGTVMRPNNVSVQRARLQIDVNNRMAAVRNREKFAKLESSKYDTGNVEQSFIITYFGDKKKEEVVSVPAKVVESNRIGGKN